MNGLIYTIGHSTHPIERFIALLEIHGITALCDVRSNPYSRMHSQFNREALGKTLKSHSISYVFLGQELGARPDNSNYYLQGRVNYEFLAQSELFQRGLDRIGRGMESYRIALMCAEKDPIMCHRTILFSRRLRDRGVEVKHILGDGTVETHDVVMNRLLKKLGFPKSDMFRSNKDLLNDVYKIQGEKLAYSITTEHTPRTAHVTDNYQ